MERNYTGMNYFDYEAYLSLAGKIKASESEYASDDLEALNDAMTSFRDYVNKVNTGEQQILLAAVRFEGEEYREMVSRYDQNRHNQHETAITKKMLIYIGGIRDRHILQDHHILFFSRCRCAR